MDEKQQSAIAALWKIYRRPDPPQPWAGGGNLPWDEPEFSQRMLREHLDQSHGAASRTAAERALQMDWLWEYAGLQAGNAILDLTCGPGLYAVEFAHRDCQVTGVDFSPASIAYARELAQERGVADRCLFIERDVRQVGLPEEGFDCALFLYGQLAVFPRAEAHALLQKTAAALKPGGRLVVSLLDQERVDKEQSSWWFTDDRGLWGERPFLHLGERHWLARERLSVERFYIIDLETETCTEIQLCDQTYAQEEMVAMMREAGFSMVDTYPNWAGLPLYDAQEWIVYLARK